MGTRKSTPKRQRKTYEAPDMAAFVQRVMRGMVRRAEAGDLEAIRALADIQASVQAAMVDAAAALRTEDANGHAYSWTDIGRELGMTRQAAQQRFGGTKGPKPAPVDPAQMTLEDVL